MAFSAVVTAVVPRAAPRRCPRACPQGHSAPVEAARRRPPLRAPAHGRRPRRQPHRGARGDTPGRLPRSLRASDSGQRGAVTRRHGCRRIVPQQVDQARERGPVVGRRRHERELDRREVVTDGEQVELPDAVRRAVGGVAAERRRFDGERADLVRDSVRQHTVDARLAFDRQAVLGGALCDQPRVTHRRPRSPRSGHPSPQPRRETPQFHRRDPSPRASRGRVSRGHRVSAARSAIRATSSAEMHGSTTTASPSATSSSEVVCQSALSKRSKCTWVQSASAVAGPPTSLPCACGASTRRSTAETTAAPTTKTAPTTNARW